MFTSLFLALALGLSTHSIFTLASPISSPEIDTTSTIGDAPPDQWDTIPTEPYDLPMIPESTAASLLAWAPSTSDTSIPTPTPSYTYAETHNDSKNTHTHEIIAGVVGALFIGVPIIGTIIFCLCRRLRGSSANGDIDDKEDEGSQFLISERQSSERMKNGRVREERHPEISNWAR
ncbi:hypothetical protein IQ06DRAFT_367784 [Phaeosphaeriaceae sp. SRC1lsM3a]|nr:hypothetical protein IQ06DRAFT_367784 [Stagonospora sp. SRC1lsM3a]